MKHRNWLMAVVQAEDPARFRTRTVETKRAKLTKNRARRKSEWRREES